MKKALAFLMAAVMLMSMLTACGNKDNAGNKDNNDVNTEETDKAAADKVAALIDKQYVEIATIGQETPIGTIQTKESFDQECNASYKAVEAAKAAFRLMGLSLPSAWSDVF